VLPLYFVPAQWQHMRCLKQRKLMDVGCYVKAYRFVGWAIIFLAALLPVPTIRAQKGGSGPVRQMQERAVYDADRPGERPGPAPRRDISGIWVPAEGPGGGIQADGAQLMPASGKPENELPFTPLGREAYQANRPSVGNNMVLSVDTNDPVKGGVTGTGCDPVGFPRLALYNYREQQILQTPESVVILYMFNKKWRAIRTDLPELPKTFDEPAWFGYSVGKWENDYTFVAHAGGFDERTWLDAAGRPHSDSLRVEERYQRVDREHLLVTIIIDDPKMYTKPWTALKLTFRLQSPRYQLHEMECAPSETLKYNELFGNPAAGKGTVK
jgi:hypothetical protein